jgi:hypothetical protein
MRWEADDELYIRMNLSWGVRSEILNVVIIKVITALWTLLPTFPHRT